MKVAGGFFVGILLISLLGVCSSYAQSEYKDVVYLKDGGVRRGLMLEKIANESVKIKTAYGDIFVIKWSDISKIVKEEILSVFKQHDSNLPFFPGLYQYKTQQKKGFVSYGPTINNTFWVVPIIPNGARC